MTKHEFLKQLKAELAGLPGAERRRQLDYYATTHPVRNSRIIIKMSPSA